jgi:hypothetical protein
LRPSEQILIALGSAGGSGIRLSASGFPASSAQGTAIGTLSVVGGIGTYTFTLTDNATNKAQVAGTNGVNLQAGSAAASASTFNVTVHADNGAGSTFDRTFTLTAWTAVANTVAPAITGSPVQGVTLSVSNGTWTGFPAPSYSYQWKRAGSPIAGATASTYALQGVDVGSAITCTVTASSGFSSANVTTSATATVTKTTLSYTPVTSATQGSAYTGATPSTTNGTSPYTYSVTGSLPAGLSVNPSTGVISGAPTTVQTASGLALVATDANGVTDTSASFSITVATSSVPTAFVLTDVLSGRLFQRTKALMTGPVAAAGTYTGGAPSAIELQVRKVSDNSIVKAWTTGTATIGSGAWSASITGVAQGGSYYVEARPSNATGLAQTGSNPFFVGIMVLMYGQSNMAGMSSTSDGSPPSAAAGTTYYSATNTGTLNTGTWGAVPAANGVRELLNGINAATGVPVGAMNAAVPGVAIESLMSGAGTNYFETAAGWIAAVGDAEIIVWHQGEGNAASTGVNIAAYPGNQSTLHTSLCSATGRTKAQMPFVLAGLGNSTSSGTDAAWDAMQAALLTCASNTATYYSHSNMDVVRLAGDVFHYDGASQGRNGKRFAQSVATVLGASSGFPRSSIASAATVDATHTDVTLSHSMGTDFTPTSAATGFDLSGDNGGTWAAATTMARTSATVLRLTHASLATDNQRQLRYQYGKLPDISNMLLNNSALTPPILMSAGNVSPTPLATSPVPTFLASISSTGSGGTRTTASQSIGAAASDRKLLILVTGHSGTSQTLTSLVITPNAGSPVTATLQLIQTTSANPMLIAFTADVPLGTTATFTLNFGGTLFTTPEFHIWSVPANNLSSGTPVASAKNQAASNTTIGLSIATTSGGFVVAAGVCAQPSNTTDTITGTETYVSHAHQAVGGGVHVAADTTNVATNASSTVTYTTSPTAGVIGVIAMSFR